MSAAAMGLLDSLCGLYLKDEQAVIKLAQHKNYGPMLVDAAFAGLPRPKCKQVSSSSIHGVKNLHMHQVKLHGWF